MQSNVQKINLDSGDVLVIVGGTIDKPSRPDWRPETGLPEYPEVTPPIHRPPTVKEILEILKPKLDEVLAKLEELKGRVNDAVKQKLQELKDKLEGLELPDEIDWEKVAEIKEKIAAKIEELKGKLDDIKDKIPDDLKDKVNEIKGKVEAIKQRIIDYLGSLEVAPPIEVVPPGAWRDRLEKVIAGIKDRVKDTQCAQAVREALDALRASLGSPDQSLPEVEEGEVEEGEVGQVPYRRRPFQRPRHR